MVRTREFDEQIKNLVKVQKAKDVIEERIREISKPLVELKDKLNLELIPLFDQLTEMNKEITGGCVELTGTWEDHEKKQFEDGYKVERRDLKTLKILNQTNLLSEIKDLKNFNELVTGFDKKKIKALCEAGLIDKISADIITKLSISCKKQEKKE